MTPYQTIKQEAKRVGYPIAYKTDLTQHDRYVLRRRKDQPQQFVWVLRKHGTFLYNTPSFPNLITLNYFDEQEGYDDPRFYIYDQGALNKSRSVDCGKFLIVKRGLAKPAQVLGWRNIWDYAIRPCHAYSPDLRSFLVIEAQRSRDRQLYDRAAAFDKLLAHWFNNKEYPR